MCPLLRQMLAAALAALGGGGGAALAAAAPALAAPAPALAAPVPAAAAPAPAAAAPALAAPSPPPPPPPVCAKFGAAQTGGRGPSEQQLGPRVAALWREGERQRGKRGARARAQEGDLGTHRRSLAPGRADTRLAETQLADTRLVGEAASVPP